MFEAKRGESVLTRAGDVSVWLEVSVQKQWLLMAPVIGDILHQSIYNLRRLSQPFG